MNTDEHGPDRKVTAAKFRHGEITDAIISADNARKGTLAWLSANT